MGGHAARPVSRTFRELVIALSHGCLVVDADICSVRAPTVRRLGVCSGADKAAGHLRSPPVRHPPRFSALSALVAECLRRLAHWVRHGRVNLRELRTSVIPCRANGTGRPRDRAATRYRGSGRSADGAAAWRAPLPSGRRRRRPATDRQRVGSGAGPLLRHRSHSLGERARGLQATRQRGYEQHLGCRELRAPVEEPRERTGGLHFELLGPHGISIAVVPARPSQ